MTALEKRALWIILGFYLLGWLLVYLRAPSAELVLQGRAKQILPSSSSLEIKLPASGGEVIIDSLHVSSSAQAVTAGVHTEKSSSKPSASKIAKGSSEKISINKASLADLQRLPGVGASTAQKILEYRKAHGGIQKADDLLEVKGIGEKKLNSLIPHITFER